MVTNKELIDRQLSWPWWRFLLTGLILLALTMSSIMSWHFLEGNNMPGCNGGSNCDQVLNSHWSTIAGIIPVSGLALGAYLAVLVASLFISPAVEESIRNLAWSAMLLLAGSIAGSAVWFTIVQKFFIGEFCIYCMTTHMTGLIFSGFVVWRAKKEFNYQVIKLDQTKIEVIQSDRPINPSGSYSQMHILKLFMIGFFLAVTLAVFQIVINPTDKFVKGESVGILPALDYSSAPVIGSTNASNIIYLLFDYQCPHCQKLHFMLNEAVKRYDDNIVFVLCPTPLNTSCNPYIPRDVNNFKNSCELAEIGLAVWFAKRDVFSSFENWMFSFESGDRWRPRSIESSRAKAVELVGGKKFDYAYANPWIKKYMKSCVELFGRTMQNGSGGIPKLIYNSRWVIPEPNNVDDFIKILQNNLGVPKP